MHPTLDAVRVLHQPPDIEFAQDLHWQVPPLVNPFDRIARARPGSQIHVISAQRRSAAMEAGGGALVLGFGLFRRLDRGRCGFGGATAGLLAAGFAGGGFSACVGPCGCTTGGGL